MATAKPHPRPKAPRQVEAEIRELLAQPLEDTTLRDRLEELAREPVFNGLTPLWGPALYRRNLVVFRPFILAHFSRWRLTGKAEVERLGDKSWRISGALRTETIPWKDDAEALDAWLAEVDRRDDVELFRNLYAWKHATGRWGGLDEPTWRADLLARFRGALDRHARNLVLGKFGQWASLDEETALALYERDPDAAGPFVLQHLPPAWSLRRGRALWGRLFERASERGDDALAFALYRKQVPLRTWEADVQALVDSIGNPDRLIEGLEKRHPEGWGLNLAPAFDRLIGRRGRDVVPYLLRHLKDLRYGYTGRGNRKLIDRAEELGWLDLWSGLIRTCGGRDAFNQAVARLVADRRLGEDEVRRRLGALAGVSREANFGPWGLALVSSLKDETAAALYDRFPELVRGPFKPHVAPTWGEAFPKLLERVLAAGDEDLTDLLASRLVTRTKSPWKRDPSLPAIVDRISHHYEELRSSNPAAFARRAVAVLGQVPAFTVWRFDELIRTNRLARLLYERSGDRYLEDPRSLRDLLEAPEIHAQALALRALGLDTDRARALAAANLDLLLPTLLRPLHRGTRLLAFRALANAATNLVAARLVLDRARQALDLPDRRYPKEPLLALIGRLLHAWPELRGPRERPVVYGEAAP